VLRLSRWEYFRGVVNDGGVTFCSDLSDGVNCRIPQQKINRRVSVRLEEFMPAVQRMTNLFKEFLLKIVSSQS